MAKQYDNTNTGAFFKNKKKKTPNHPDYTGSLNVEGTEYWVSVWNKTSKEGNPYCSLAIQQKESDSQPKAKPTLRGDMDDEIPF